GLDASITGLPDRFSLPAARIASAATLPLTANTTSSPNFAASTKLPIRALEFAFDQSASFVGVRVPTQTLCPCFRKPAARAFATSPDPSIPTFMAPSFDVKSSTLACQLMLATGLGNASTDNRVRNYPEGSWRSR